MKSIGVKNYLKKETFRTFSIAFLFALIYLITHFNESFLLNISNALFVIAAVYIVVGGTRYIRNVGLFKTFSYFAYKRRWKHGIGTDGELHPMSLADYTVNIIMDEKRQKPVMFPLCIGGGCTALSALLSFLHFQL
nr:DUF3899 domain-containing protein [uncultured Sellimonas sp.]